MYNETMVMAIRTGNLDKIKQLVETKQVRIHEEEEFALKQAAFYGQLEIIKYFVEEHDFDINASNSFALAIAIAHKNDDIVEYLISKGSKFDFTYKRENVGV